MSEREVSPSNGALRWVVAPWAQPFWYAYLAFCWWQAGLEGATRAGVTKAAFAAALVPAGKFAGFMTEAGFYSLWWRGGGRRLPFWRFFCIVASISLTDVLSMRLREIAHGGSAHAAEWLAPVAGLSLWPGIAAAHPAWPLVLGSLGLLTALRIGATAWAQARALALPPAVALAWTGLVWLLGRLVCWWITDLARGVSPLPMP